MVLGRVLLLVVGHISFAGTNRPAAPVNVSVSQLRADSAVVSWEVPEGELVIGFSVSQQRRDGLMQRSIREVNTSSHACALWELHEDTDYIIQVQSVGLFSESLASQKIHFRTLKKSEDLRSAMMEQDEPVVEGLDMSRHLQTGEVVIIMAVLLMWAAVIVLFCKQYENIKDNDSSNHCKEKSKAPSGRSSPAPPTRAGGGAGALQPSQASSVSIISV